MTPPDIAILLCIIVAGLEGFVVLDRWLGRTAAREAERRNMAHRRRWWQR